MPTKLVTFTNVVIERSKHGIAVFMWGYIDADNESIFYREYHHVNPERVKALLRLEKHATLSTEPFTFSLVSMYV